MLAGFAQDDQPDLGLAAAVANVIEWGAAGFIAEDLGKGSLLRFRSD